MFALHSFGSMLVPGVLGRFSLFVIGGRLVGLLVSFFSSWGFSLALSQCRVLALVFLLDFLVLNVNQGYLHHFPFLSFSVFFYLAL